MTNQYIYFSSKGQNDNADFQVKFSNPITIMPHSEIRCCSIKVNPKNNQVFIDETNDTFAFSIGTPWVSTRDGDNMFGFYPVKLQHGLYNTESGPDKDVNLVAQMEDALNKACSNNSLIRGGFSCTISNKVIDIKLSYMNGGNFYYGIPSSGDPLPKYLLEEYRQYSNETAVSLQTLGGQVVVKDTMTPFDIQATISTVDPDSEDFACVSLSTNAGGPLNQYFISPCINWMGIADPVDDDLQKACFMEIDLDDIDFSNIGDREFKMTWDLVSDDNEGIKFNAPLDEPSSCFATNLDYKKLPNPEFWNNALMRVACYNNNNKAYFILYYKDENGQTRTKRASCDLKQLVNIYVGVNNNVSASNRNVFNVYIHRSNDGGSNWTELAKVEDNPVNGDIFTALNKPDNKNIKADAVGKPCSIRAALKIELPDGASIPQDCVMFGCAYDPQWDKGGYFDGDFQEAMALTKSNTNVKAPLCFYSNDDITDKVLNDMANSLSTVWNPDKTLLLKAIPIKACVDLGFDEAGVQYGQNSWDTGVKLPHAVNTNRASFPMYYLSLEDLPLENRTADSSFGKQNRFIYPVDIQTAGGVRTSSHVDMYNSLHNSYKMTLTSMRIRICDIEGNSAENTLDDYTIGCLEIRENPVRAQMRMMKQILDRGNKDDRASNQDQIKPFGSQVQ